MEDNKFSLAILISVEIALLLLINLTMITWAFTRRSAEDLEKLERVKTINVISCKDNGGNAIFTDSGNFFRCDFKR